MYLVRIPHGRPISWLFVHSDPRAEGCRHQVQSDVTLDESAAHAAAFDRDARGVVLGRSTRASNIYRRFVGARVPPGVGFESLSGRVLQLTSWTQFRERNVKLNRKSRAINNRPIQHAHVVSI